MKFKVHGQGTRLFGDGFAFWYTKDKSTLGIHVLTISFGLILSMFIAENIAFWI